MTGPRASRWRRRLTIPNALSLFRISAAPMLVVLAASGEARRMEVVALFALMSASDWLDGKIALRFNQRSDIGPRVDSVADMSMYLALLVAAVLLDGDTLRQQWPWIGAPVVMYVVAGVASVSKFGRWPHHHTRMAKVSWGLMLIGAVAFLGGWSWWPLRVALLSAALASVQSMAITRILPVWRPDVLTVSEARRIAVPQQARDERGTRSS